MRLAERPAPVGGGGLGVHGGGCTEAVDGVLARGRGWRRPCRALAARSCELSRIITGLTPGDV